MCLPTVFPQGSDSSLVGVKVPAHCKAARKGGREGGKVAGAAAEQGAVLNTAVAAEAGCMASLGEGPLRFPWLGECSLC